MYGWEEFGHEIKSMDGVLEIPMTLSKFGPMHLPVAGGVYFRVLPRFLILNAIRKKFQAGEPVLSYFHPYDADTDQEDFTMP